MERNESKKGVDMGKVTDGLARAYFEKFLIRVEILQEFYKRKGYSDVIREGQEALELFMKGLLRETGVEPSHSHDPGRELQAVKSNVSKYFQAEVDALCVWSKKLRKDRELSFYGARDFIPTEEYTEEDAKEVIQFQQKIADLLKKYLKS